MTNDEIIALAQKSGFETKRGMIWVDQWEVSRLLERFAALVAAAEREKILEMCKEGWWDAAGIRHHLEKQDGIRSKT